VTNIFRKSAGFSVTTAARDSCIASEHLVCACHLNQPLSKQITPLLGGFAAVMLKFVLRFVSTRYRANPRSFAVCPHHEPLTPCRMRHDARQSTGTALAAPERTARISRVDSPRQTIRARQSRKRLGN
jgi:hypothetical protein